MKTATPLHYHSVIRMLGVLLLVIGFAMIPAALVGLFYGEMREAGIFTATIIPCLLAGLLVVKMFNPAGLRTRQREGYLIVTLFWVVAPLISAIPFLIAGMITNPIDAFFELCSGYSTTGATILSNLEHYPKSLMFWRSLTHWLGGMGIVVLATALLPSIGIGGQTIANAETPGPTMSKLTARFSDTSRRLYILYAIFTVAEAVLLMAGGLSLYDALIHTFGTVGTGGFSNYSDSVGHFTSPYVRWVITAFMILCGINFNLYFLLFQKRFKEFFSDEEKRLYLGMIGGFILLITLDLLGQGGYTSFVNAFSDASFHVASIVTTTGFATTDYDVWPAFCKTLIVILTITGACASSTGGGVKMIRILTAIKYVRRGFFLKLHPNRVINLTVNGKAVGASTVTNIVNFIFFFVAVLFAGTLLVSVDGFDIVTNFSAALTCLSNVGPGLNLVGPSMNFAAYSNFPTLVLAILMIAGRLELFTVFMMLSRNYWNSDRA